jgi:hypothetical protein
MTINLKALGALKGLVNKDFVEKTVTREWRKKAKCLENLTNENKHELKTIELKLLGNLVYEDKKANDLYEELKNSSNITSEQKRFANFLYKNYPKYSLKALGFD